MKSKADVKLDVTVNDDEGLIKGVNLLIESDDFIRLHVESERVVWDLKFKVEDDEENPGMHRFVFDFKVSGDPEKAFTLIPVSMVVTLPETFTLNREETDYKDLRKQYFFDTGMVLDFVSIKSVRNSTQIWKPRHLKIVR